MLIYSYKTKTNSFWVTLLWMESKLFIMKKYRMET